MAAQLKEAGNAAFAAKDFSRAHGLYTEAIALDGQNAVLYANRSACSFGMGRYVDALRDAKRATDVDPGYAKGWSRLATAHDAALEFESAVEAWTRARSALQKENASAAELKQREQYAASLDKAKARLAAARAGPSAGILVSDTRTEKTPWALAEEMMPELHAAGRAMFSSSAYLIHHANQEWQEGVNYMKILKRVPTKRTPDEYQVIGHTAGLTAISNGLMRDMRVFRLDSNDWVKKYNEQVCFEVQKHRAWASDPLETIQRESLQRLKKEGWDSLRPALAVVVRAWIMRAAVDSQLRHAPHMGVERLKETLQLLNWGRRVWRNVHKDDRGAIFEDTFVRGVKAMYIESLLGAHAKATSADQPALLDTLLSEAREMIEEAESIPRPTGPDPKEAVDPGFVSSFYVYPVAEAYAAAGYCFVQKSMTEKNLPERMVSCAMAIKQYSAAAQMLPEDDEKHVWYLRCTIPPMLSSGAPKSTVMGVVKAIRAAMPKMQRIWANSALAKQGRDAMIEETLRDAERA